jgi:hypothetical protein
MVVPTAGVPNHELYCANILCNHFFPTPLGRSYCWRELKRRDFFMSTTLAPLMHLLQRATALTHCLPHPRSSNITAYLYV